MPARRASRSQQLAKQLLAVSRPPRFEPPHCSHHLVETGRPFELLVGGTVDGSEYRRVDRQAAAQHLLEVLRKGGRLGRRGHR